MYVSYNTALEITPPTRNKLPFVLVKAAPGVAVAELTQRITAQTGLQALSQNDFAWRSINYILERTGIPVNFGITIVLGVIIGLAITAQTFYIFVVENLKQFAALKAIGVTNGQLLRMVLAQAAIVGVSGYGLGVGCTALFFAATADVPALKGFQMYWQVVAGSGVAMTVIILVSILFSLRRVFKLDPAMVFRG
jgi:putative ABC transport system permease protein